MSLSSLFSFSVRKNRFIYLYDATYALVKRTYVIICQPPQCTLNKRNELVSPCLTADISKFKNAF